jgi:L-ribulokinase
MLVQIYADVTGRPIAVAGAPQASALGAAMLGAVAAGSAGGGHDSLRAAAARMAPPPTRVYEPLEPHRREYDGLYREYKRLYDYFGRGSNEVMALLRGMRRARPTGPA